MAVVIETTLGDITVDLYLNSRPNTCLNFLKLCKIKYYNLCVFHKVERNFIAQTGDPTATGRGGESVFCHLYGDQAKFFEAELKPRLKHEKLGTLSMVNNGNNMNGSQFFITLGENLTYLDEVHTVFGEVAEGFETLLKINEAICDPNNRPYQDIRITHTVILHDPYEDPQGLVIPDASPEPTKEQLESNYIGADEEIDDTKGKSMEEIEEHIKESEAKARATILEMVGDIPDADVKPPETVLFVCKLNPVTTSEDLEVIFSRFGPIVSCEVIKDKKTGESLQYAFIEFEKEEDCENAYFKMDNVLIDDRRIHVDFSQSVSKLNWKDGKPPKPSSRRDNFVVKNSAKSDGYDMIFDMNESPDKTSPERNKPKQKSKASEHKNSLKSYDIDKYQSKRTSRSSEYKSSPKSYDSERYPRKNYSWSPDKKREDYRENKKSYLSYERSDSYRRYHNRTSDIYESKNKYERTSHQKSRSVRENYSPKFREREVRHISKAESEKKSKYDTSKRYVSRSSSSSSTDSDSSGVSPNKKASKKRSKRQSPSDSDSSSSSSSHTSQQHPNRKSHFPSSSHPKNKKIDKYSQRALPKSASKSPEQSFQKRTRKYSPSTSRKRSSSDSSPKRGRSRSPKKDAFKYGNRKDSYGSRGNDSQDCRLSPKYSSRTIRREQPHSKDVKYKESDYSHQKVSSYDSEHSHKKHSSKKKKQRKRSSS